jgi:putative heme-binding domain-containing protein
MLTRRDDAPPYRFAAYEAPAAPAERLWAELSSPAWSRRQAAHVELLRRGGEFLDEAARRLSAADPRDPAMPHLVWLAAAGRTPAAAEQLTQLAVAADPAIRTHAVRALAEFELSADAAVFSRALADANPPLRHAAAAALFARHESLDELGEALDRVASSRDSYLRQAATLLAARRGQPGLIDRWLHAPEGSLRLAGVLSAGFRLTLPPATGPLSEKLPLRYESGNALFVVPYADATIDLKQLARVGSFTIAERYRALGFSDEERHWKQALVERLADGDDAVSAQAGYFLSLFAEEPLDRLVAEAARRRTLKRLDAAPRQAIVQAWLLGPISDGAGGLNTVHPVEQGPIDLAAGDAPNALAWNRAALGDGSTLTAASANASSYLYFRLQSFAPQTAAITLGTPGEFRAWHNGQPLAAASPLLVPLEPGSNEVLLRLAHGSAAAPVRLELRAAEPLEIALPEKPAAGSLAERLRQAAQSDGASVPEEFLSSDWTSLAARGDAERGRRLFGADGLGCAKCHAILPTQKGGGAPSLAAAVRRFTVPHLVESVLVPSKQVAPVFGTTSIVTVDGRTHSGLAVAEDDRHVVLLLPTAERIEVQKSEIEGRKLSSLSPMPAGLVKTPAELADLLAYLLSAEPRP